MFTLPSKPRRAWEIVHALTRLVCLGKVAALKPLKDDKCDVRDAKWTQRRCSDQRQHFSAKRQPDSETRPWVV
ncbi:hypothetical protein B0J13DRAFT_199799 [Dactylonectria estremocensis]|uniref:Uncharacterized protein n=1 Tax=Dactylonectria estremocensis TaxID=1079267 RepID=A0A9P9DFL6_9HYPO|nr:hypothetical protein B0J13DRAFT_199799 [Dactylonectria estremocensis]